MFSAYSLPVTITSGGREYPIRNQGDYRVILDVIAALNDDELEEDERMEAALIIFLDCDIETLPNPLEAAEAMMEFLRCGYADAEHKNERKLMDWQDDAPMIISGVNRVLGREVRAVPYMHWWTFFAAYMEIGESTLATVISIRDKLARGRKLEKYEERFWLEHPELFTFSADRKRAQQDLEDLTAIWGKGDDE